ncbi:MAG: DUF4474 domain-containing protein [Oscillospiraceae bacterium]|jgi:cell division septation protein DedD|nr:DUF4474 domain-containing protein [Oscillospiraceae bacterium]
MKRSIAVLLAGVLCLSVLAGCGSKEEDSSTEPSSVTTAASPAPEGYIPFAEADINANLTVTETALLEDSVGDSVEVNPDTKLTANLSDTGELQSVSDTDGHSFSVFVYAAGDTITIYGKAGKAVSTTEETTTAAPATTTKAKTTTAAKSTTKPGTSTTKKPTTTASTAAKTTTKAPTTTLSASQLQEQNGSAFSFLNYTRDANGVWYTEHEPWQKQFGFNQIYDWASPLIQLVYSTVRIKFRYDYVYQVWQETADGHTKGTTKKGSDGKPLYELDSAGNKIPKDWLIQMWKGRYGIVLIGGEIGIYTKPSTQTTEHYYSAVKEEELVMAIDIYQQNFLRGTKEKLFTRGPMSEWWITGFVPGAFYEYNKKAEIIMVGNLQFPNTTMLAAFEKPFAAAGFKKGSPGRDTPETYTTSGTSLKFSWQYLDQDA